VKNHISTLAFATGMLAVLLVGHCGDVRAQATIQSGSISGTITDPSDAAVPGAKITITSHSTGQKILVSSSSTGTYNSGPLGPGIYTVRVEAPGFTPTDMTMGVDVGTISPGNAKLEVAGAKAVITVEATGVRVNTEQATVQGVITSEQIENLPTNGRNFLAIAGLEPGVQIQDGGNFDPTKIGFIGISVGGRQGRTTRIEVDGLDISDETVGTTTQNIPAASIQEFQISQSSLDFSTELTSSGAVNIATKTGSKDYHGDAFYLFRDKRAGGADFPGGLDNPYQRNHVGGTFGGPIVPQKLFFFVAGERILQHLLAPVTFSPPFDTLNGGYQSPYKEKETTARLDYNLFGNAKLFYKFSYDNNTVVGNLLPNYSAFANLDNTPSHAVGLDFTSGKFTHSIRFGYLKFQNHISDAVQSTGAYNPLPTALAEYRITGTSPSVRFGPNHLAPQATFQSNKQIKYDGSMTWQSHIFRYGASFNRILGGGFAAFYGIGPAIRSRVSRAPIADTGPFPGGRSNPLNYPVTQAFLGNGQGFFTETPEFGYPAGGQFDSRMQFYVGDSWKIRRTITFTIGLRYNRDTGRTDSDLAPIPCSAINTANFSPTPPCTGNLLDNFGNIPGLGNRVNQANGNFGGTLGVAWDPTGSGKTVIRAGGGVYYENAVFNNVLFDRPVRLANGLFFTITPGSGNMCPQGVVTFPGGVNVTTTPTGKNIATQVCGQPIGSVAADIVALQQSYQAAVIKAGASTNPAWVGETLDPNAGGNLYAPNYEVPRSFQMNVGVQRELWKGAVVSADYVRNVSLRYLLGVDTNHVGDARYLNATAAGNAIAATLSACGAGSIDASIQHCPGLHPFNGTTCTTVGGCPATISDYADNGVDSGVTYLGGSPAEAFGLNPLTDGAAFGGINPWYGTNTMLFPVGRSVYDGLLVTVKQGKQNLLPFLPQAHLHFSYALSRFKSMAGDQDFINTAFDQANPTRFFGPASFDRTHQISFGTTFGFPKMGAFQGVQLSLAGRFASPLPTTLVLEDQSRAGEIFHTDWTGDGTTGDILPGQNIGSFMRGANPSNLASVISQYNSSQAGTLTPAGQALVSAGLFTQAQLVALGTVKDIVPAPVPGAVGNDWARGLDTKVSFPFRVREHITIDPSFAFFNLLNFANFGGAGGLSGILNGAPGSAGYTLYNQQGNRVGLGSGVFQSGAPRQIEFGLRVSF